MNKLPISEELSFHYLLELMPPLHNEPEFAWLPELFAIIGHRALIQLCRYAGGEYIKIPSIDELSDSIDALQWFYDTTVSKKFQFDSVPDNLKPLVRKIQEIYHVRNNQIDDFGR